MTITRVVVHGAAGRMGRAVVAALDAGGVDARLVAAVERDGDAAIGRDAGELAGVATLGVKVAASLAAALAAADVVIDFSSPAATPAVARACAARRVALVVGTTGLDADATSALAEAARAIPTVVAANFSIGVAVLAHLVARAATLLPGWDAEIVEMHHRAKRDAPSGTALRIARAVAEARGQDLAKSAVHGRSGTPGPRPDGEIGILAMRGGDVIGDHTLVLAGPDERLELSHRATSRDLFARGAIRAATWTVGRAPGQYTMADVLGL